MFSFNPGEVSIDLLVVVSPRQSSWNMAPNLITASVVETIFTPGIMGEIEVIDYEDYLGKLEIKGDEQVLFQFTKPNGASAFYIFHLNSVKFVTNEASMKAKTYKLMCISRESLVGQGNHVQKSYNDQISNIIKDLFQQLNSSLSPDIETTSGIRNIKIPNQNIFSAIESLRKESISEKNKSSNFMFYLSQNGIHFKTMEQMMTEGDVKTFKQDNTVGHSMNSDFDHNILSWQVVQNMDAMQRILSGAINQRVATFNSHTNEFVKADFKPSSADFTNLGLGSMITEEFKSLFNNVNKSILRYVNPNQNLKIGKSNVPDNIAYKMLNLAQMQEQLLRMTVLGDPVLEAGKTIVCNVPQITNVTNASQLDSQVSGRWLISKLEHDIRRMDKKPRYLNHIEGIKGSFEK